MVKPLCDDPLRTKERRFVRARARGMSARASAIHAGYSGGHAYLLQRRLRGEVAQERAKLAGMNGGHVPPTFSQVDAHRILRAELGRLVDNAYRPHAKRLEAQTIRDLARQITLGDAREHHKRLNTQLDRERKNSGSVSPRTLAKRELARRLIEEIEAYRDARSAGEEFSPVTNGKYLDLSVAPTRAREGLPGYPNALVSGQGGGDAPREAPKRQQSGPPAQRPATCPTHPSEPFNGCRLCRMDPVKRWRAEQEERDREVSFPKTYGW